MRSFGTATHVRVRAIIGTDVRTVLAAPVVGVVRRKRRCDDLAWVELPERLAEPIDAHPFPADCGDDRARHVLCAPEDCDRVSAPAE